MTREPAARGAVTLVGAGPGDPELLTIKAARAIAAADVILIDDLVDRRVLQHAGADARVVPVGKRGGCASTPQAFIERLMASEALAGWRVVRLKGGDPFMFGRGGEEVAYLRARGIAVDVVPGITSGMAAPASIGVPLTHRADVQGVVFLTGHAKSDEDEVDWERLARLRMTLVVYMGVARAPQIRRRLLAGGMRADMPIAVVQQATWRSQRALVTTLATLDHDVCAARLASPSVLIIGDVVRHADPVRLHEIAVAATCPDEPESASMRASLARGGGVQ